MAKRKNVYGEKPGVYTDDELILRIWDKEEIRMLMARRAFYQMNEQRRRELDELWVTGPEYRRTASFGRNWGWYVGMEEIAKYYVVAHNERMYAALREYNAQDPKVAVSRENLGRGYMSAHPVGTPRVVIAGDRKTARGLWYSVGQETTGHPAGKSEAMWFSEIIAADLVREEAGWKIWHIYFGNDVFFEAGTNENRQPVRLPAEEEWANKEFGTPTIPYLVHDKLFAWADNYPPVPEPYQTFDIRDSYAPEGHPGYREDCL